MKKAIRYIIIIALIGSAVYAYTLHRKHKNKPEWRTDTASTGSIRELVTATGSLNPHLMVNVGTEVSGKIEKIYKDYNSIVKKGDLLAKLDTELLESALESAKNDVARAKISADEAKLDLDLQQELFKKEMSAEYELKKAQFKHQQAVQSHKNAQLSLQRAQKNLDNAYIISPINGVIVSRNVDEGQTVAASLNAPTLFVIANNLENMQITATVDEADIGKISYNLPVEFTVDAYTGERFRGKINQIRLNPNSEQNVVSYNVIVDAPNPQRKLLPGMTANVTIVIQSKDEVLRIPESATRFRPNKELWQLFGLKWDEELTAGLGLRGRNRDASANATPAKPGETPNPGAVAKQGEPSSQTKTPGEERRPGSRRGQMPDSLRSKIPAAQTPSAGETFQLSTGGSKRRSMRMGMIWVLENGIPTPKTVQLGLSDGAFVEVLEGIEPEMQLITGVIYKNSKQMSANNPMMQSGPGVGRRF